jgi:hypothetical protein
MARLHQVDGSYRDADLPPNAAAMFTKLEAALTQVEAGAETPAAWAALTAAQKDEANRRAALAVCKLARLTLGRLESA